MSEAIEAAKARAAELQAQKEEAEKPVLDLSNVDLDELETTPPPAPVVDLSQPSSVTPNFSGQLTQGAPSIPQATQRVGANPVTNMDALHAAMDEEAADVHRNFKTFRHMFAGSNVVMADGTKLVFGGRAGQPGYYTTDVLDEIAFLKSMCRSANSMMAEEEGRMSPEMAALRARAAEDARRNTLLETDPNIVAARNNLGQAIARDGGNQR